MKNERLGLIMIATSIVVAALIMWLVHAQQLRLHRDQIHALGVTMTRVLSSADMSQLLPQAGNPSLVAKIDSFQASDAFAYRTVIDLSGHKLFEYTAVGSVVPSAIMPSDPTAWYGEQSLVSPSNGRNIREYFGPVLKNGELAGFVRSGYYENPKGMQAADISYAAMLTLPVFLLTAISYLLIRRELRPLAVVGTLIEESEIAHCHEPLTWTKLELRHCIQRLEQHVLNAKLQTGKLETQYLKAQTTNHLLAYRQEKTQAVLDAIPEAVMVLDDRLVPVFANPKVQPFLGVGQSELIGMAAERWCTNKEVLALLMSLRQKNGPSLRPSNVSYSPEGHPDRSIRVTTFPLLTPRDPGTPFATLVIFRDTSEENSARQASENFVAQVAHELKTPLNTLLAYSELLLDYGELNEGERVNAVNVIHDEVERAAALINNLLNISKLESGTLPITRQRVRLAELLRDSSEKMRASAEARGVKLEVKVPPDIESISIDKDLFRIAIDNLLNNAIKYSDAGGTVTLAAANLTASEMKISVTDQGIGMSPEDCKKAFDKYYRSSEAQAALRNGHGLGLHLARQIVELHHGVLSVTSVLGKGTTFAIQFAVQSAKLQEAATA